MKKNKIKEKSLLNKLIYRVEIVLCNTLMIKNPTMLAAATPSPAFHHMRGSVAMLPKCLK